MLRLSRTIDGLACIDGDIVRSASVGFAGLSSLGVLPAAAIADARAKVDDAQLFEKVKTAYETALKYPAVIAVVEKTAPVAAKAVEVAGPYYVKAKEAATPYVAKATEVAGPYVTMVADKFTKKVPELD